VKKMERACVICNYTITNPVCTDCLKEEVLCFLADHNEKLVEDFKDYNKIFPKNSKVSRCIICGELMDTCPHCYCNDISKLIKNNILKDTFIETFNFELT
jgi:hypothetical protein